ncbi:site-specific integrase [Chryseolinea sp. H1M3-3]|uniref:site-specific integrase n=1 Tax=Chryseolinea sp. H1M3-3 TaxID=3034144 RepID=UPI0023EB2E9A|nr:site-specific integrase [Chryseolinea sp. H1M3-3]
MNSNVVLALDTRRKKADQTYPILLRLSHNGKTTGLSTGFSIPEQYWDFDNRKIKKGFKGFDNVARINNILEKERSQAFDIISKLHDRKELSYLSIVDLKNRIVAKGAKDSFFRYTEKLIAKFQEQKRIGNARSYSNVLREVKKFRNEIDFPLRELNRAFLDRFENWYLAKGLSLNGLAVYMRTIRAICNRAIKKDRILEKESYPFDQYTIKTKPTKKRAISFELIQKIVALKFENDSVLFETRNIFLLSFGLMGAPFIDLAFLKVENIIDGRVHYKRRKTGKFYDIKLTDGVKPILSHYLKDKAPSEFILPIIKRTELAEQYKDIEWARKRYNKRLKKIAKAAGIDENLTSYVSRHSFASLANNMAIPVTAISEMLGHQRLSTTQVYLANLKKDVIDQYNDKILQGINTQQNPQS